MLTLARGCFLLRPFVFHAGELGRSAVSLRFPKSFRAMSTTQTPSLKRDELSPTRATPAPTQAHTQADRIVPDRGTQQLCRVRHCRAGG